ncbi:MAG: hypothetical protein OEZ68_18135 [Gammaproteobacteria bacterium]|nr:hypothetical protein [Gammaproteobacteria bacterium]MDH5802725.1 hypothetical protein [Gammaproteobacteria bacterium]
MTLFSRAVYFCSFFLYAFASHATSAGVSVGSECEALNEDQVNVQKWSGQIVSYNTNTEVYCPVQREVFAAETLNLTMTVVDNTSADTSCTAYSQYQSGSLYAFTSASTSGTGTKYIGFSGLSIPLNGSVYIKCNVPYSHRIVQYRYN